MLVKGAPAQQTMYIFYGICCSPSLLFTTIEHLPSGTVDTVNTEQMASRNHHFTNNTRTCVTCVDIDRIKVDDLQAKSAFLDIQFTRFYIYRKCSCRCFNVYVLIVVPDVRFIRTILLNFESNIVICLLTKAVRGTSYD